MRDFLEYVWETKGTLFAIVSIVTTLSVLLVWVMNEAEDDCAARGGQLYQSGVVTTYVQVDKTLVPIQSPVFSCTK